MRLTWYNNISPDKTVEIVNYLKNHADAGETVFYDIYTEEEKAVDPDKEDTGLFFFKGNPGEKFAVCNASDGFAYVGAMQDSFPHALELSKKGYNAFALIYRSGAQTACEDLARAISFIFEHAEELEVDTDCYSLWGGSAGGRMAAWLGSYGPAAFGGDDLPQPGAVIMQYTGHSDYTENDPPTYACVPPHIQRELPHGDTITPAWRLPDGSTQGQPAFPASNLPSPASILQREGAAVAHNPGEQFPLYICLFPVSSAGTSPRLKWLHTGRQNSPSPAGKEALLLSALAFPVLPFVPTMPYKGPTQPPSSRQRRLSRTRTKTPLKGGFVPDIKVYPTHAKRPRPHIPFPARVVPSAVWY